MHPRSSETAEWLQRGYHLFSAGYFWAALFGSSVLVAGVINPLIQWMGPGGFVIFFVGAFGLVVMVTIGVLGYRDPLSPWQLARRYERLSRSASRFAFEVQDALMAAREEPSVLMWDPANPSAPPSEEALQNWQSQSVRQARQHKEAMREWQMEYTGRILSQWGLLVEHTKDAGYVLPESLAKVAWRPPVNHWLLDELARELSVMGARLASRTAAKVERRA